MAFRTVLTFTDGSTASERRLEAAVGTAAQTDAHLVVLAFGFEPDLTYVDGFGGTMAAPPSNAGPQSEEAAEKARDLIARAGIRGEAVPVVCTYGRFGRELGTAAQFSDLVVLGRPYGDGAPSVEAEAFAGALFDGDATVLLFPDNVRQLQPGPVLIAWNGSREALRAVRRALPLLTGAARVEITIFGPTPAEPLPGQRLATWLSRHGVGAEIVAQITEEDGPTASLGRRVTETGAGLVVMGAYSHSRFREYVIGGVTRDYLAAFSVPVLTAH
jgi:nucleotide-binding universal stress UspA family protein